MPSTKPRALKTHFLALLTVLIVAAGLITSCNKQQGPTPGPKPATAPEGETIIVIKGGSVEVGFDENRYKPDNQTTHKQYECADCSFLGFEVGPDEYNLTACDTDKNSTIHIKVKDGGKKDIYVKKKPNAEKGIVIDLDNEEYPVVSGKHYKANNVIDDVKVTPNSLCACPDTGDGKCYIRIRTSPN